MSEVEVADAIETALSIELNIHPSDVEVNYDQNTGVATYTIISDDAESLNSIINEMKQDDFDISLAGITIESIIPSDDISINIDVTVDASSINDADTILDSVVEGLQTSYPSFVVDGTIDFITAAPSNIPSLTPTKTPSTSIPTAIPSSSGWISTLTATSIATNQHPTSEIESYVSDVAEFYGVDHSSIDIETSYEVSGEMLVMIPNNVSESELTEAIKISVAESLEVHPSNVDVVINMETGEVDFTISSDVFNEAASVRFDLNKDQYEESIVNEIENAIPSIIVDRYDVNDDVVFVFEIVVDANEAENDLTQAEWHSEQLLSDFNVNIESNFYNFLKTYTLFVVRFVRD